MPIKTPGGILEVEDAKLRASYLLANTSVGIGTSTTVPDGASLYIDEDNPTIRFQEGTTTSAARILAKSGTLRLESGTDYDQPDLTGDIAFSNIQGGTTHMIIKGDGNVGIGTDSPSQMLDVSGNVQVGTANLFVDTTTGRVGVGVTDPGHNLDIVSEMNLRAVSNTASIKYNSNVVTEYVRSKKLIKYPRVKMTAATTSGYVASASTEHLRVDNPASGLAYDAFGNLPPFEGGWRAVTSSSVYSSGDYIGSVQVTDVNGVTYSGEWLQIEMPKPINVKHIRIAPRTEPSYVHVDRAPTKFTILASNNGTSWYNILHRDNETYSNSNTWKLIEVNHSLYYDTFRIVVHSIGSTGDHAEISKLEYYGIPEYDPDSRGTDVIARSVPNVPNTDWLEVYYDGQDYTSMPSTVTDKSGNGVTGTPSGVTFDSTWKAFTFPGSTATSNISNTSFTFPSGDTPHTFSAFFKLDTIPETSATSRAYIASFGELADSSASGVGITTEHVYWANRADDTRHYFDFKPNTWYHICAVYVGGGLSVENKHVFINGEKIQNSDKASGNGAVLSIPSTSTLVLGNWMSASTSTSLDGSIANFRLFNRALTADEVWQLYAYQKDYFQVSPDVVTFKGGRLGIGTSEPQAGLDVNGTLRAHSITLTNNTPPIFKISLQTNQANANDVTTFNKRDIFDTINGAVIKINNSDLVSLNPTNSASGNSRNSLTFRYQGYYRITGNILYEAFVDRVAIAVQPHINDNGTGEIFINNYIRNYSRNTRSGTSFSTIYFFNKDDELSFYFAKYGVDDNAATIVGNASFIMVEKL